MRISIISHAGIHPRQYLFWDYLNSLPDSEVLEIYPKTWGNQSREGGFQVAHEGSIKEFTFWDDAFQAIRDFSPDLIYSQTEPWQAQAFRSGRWARALKIPLVYFFWENLQVPSTAEVNLINDAELIVCGNAECQSIINEACPDVHTEVMSQVGIRTDIFKPNSAVYHHDVLFVGRPTPEKGLEYVQRLENDGFDVLRATGAKYTEMPYLYNSAQVLIVPSLTTDSWVEQWPACIAEALACEVPVVAFDSGSITSNYSRCHGPDGGVFFVNEGDYEGLKNGVFAQSGSLAKKGREWILKHMGHEAIAKKLLKAFEEIR